MLADELDYVVGVDTHRDRARAGGCRRADGRRGRAAIGAGERARLRGGDSVRRASTRLACGCGRLRARDTTERGLPATERSRRDGARERPRPARRATAARQGRPARRGSRRTYGAGERDACLAADGSATRGVAAAVARTPQRGRRSSTSTRAAAQRDRDRARSAPRATARLPEPRLLERCSRLRRSSSCPADELATKLVLRTLARRIEAATTEAAQLEREILAHVRAIAPQLLDRARRRSDRRRATDRRLVTPRPRPLRSRLRTARRRRPVPASSGQTIRHRLSRGGDRQLNRALHTIVLHRRQHDPATRAYIGDGSPKAKPDAKQPASSSATSPATSTASCNRQSRS